MKFLFFYTFFICYLYFFGDVGAGFESMIVSQK